MKKTKLIQFTLTLCFLIYSTVSFCQEIKVLNPTTTTVQDAVIGSIVPDNNYGLIEDLHVYNWTQGGILNTVRPLLEFDLSILPENIEIVGAQLKLYHNPTSIYGEEHSGDNGFYMERITSEWDQEIVTWNTQPQTTIENRIEVSSSLSNDQNYVIEVTNLVSDMINNPDSSFGFMLKHIEEEPYKVNFLSSSQHSDISLHPELTVTYNVITSTRDTELEQLVNIYPNPTLSKIYFSFPFEIEVEKIIVMDSSGKLIYQFNEAITEINISNKGFYIVEIFTSKGKVVKKLLVN